MAKLTDSDRSGQERREFDHRGPERKEPDCKRPEHRESECKGLNRGKSDCKRMNRRKSDCERPDRRKSDFRGPDHRGLSLTAQFALRSLPWKRILSGTGITAAILLALFLGYIWRLIAAAPDIDLITVSPVESATYICSPDGSYLRKLTLASSNRDIVTLDEIPDSLQKAVIAIEDERFYEHGGIDIRGIVRAFAAGVFSGSFSEGASTITQQLIKNNVFTEWTQEDSFRERFRRKIQEQYLALQLEKRISKEEILEDYLNTINLGAGCYGVQAAARRYFGKDVSELSVSESAVLAAIPQNPSRYNPITNPEENGARRAVVLAYMTAQGYLSPEEKQAALEDDVYTRIQESDAASGEATVYSYYEDALIDQAIDALMEEKGLTSDQAYRAVYSGGLRIYSAQDDALQQICEEEFQNPANFPEGTEFGIDYALSVMDADGQTTHYGSESLRSYVREHLNESFDLLCTSQEEAQSYADAFRTYILESMTAQNPSADRTSAESADPGDSSGPGAESGDPPALPVWSGGSPSSAEESGDSSGESSQNSEESGGCTVLGERLSLSPQPQASLVLMDQKTGLVRAIVGGRGEKTASLTLNRATETTRQPGSTFKILTAYAPAIDAFGQTLATLYENEPYEYEDGTPVSNWDITDYTGTVTVREAITRSINVIAVKCITEISPRTGFEYARRFGISTLHETFESADGLSSDVIQPLALGGITQGVTNLELCSAYAAIANGGIYRTPKFFTRILDRQGNVLIDWTEKNIADGSPADHTRVLSESTAFLLTDAMRDVVNAPDGTAYGMIEAGTQPVAGKTGTTSNYKDIWFVGYTPQYTCCVWGGYDNNQSLPDGSHSYSKTLWSSVMNRVHKGIASSDFPIPESVEPITLCRSSHLPAVPGGCMETYTEFFAVGTEPEQECPLHEPAPRPETKIHSLDDLLSRITGRRPTETESETSSETTDSEQNDTDAGPDGNVQNDILSGLDGNLNASVQNDARSRSDRETETPVQDDVHSGPVENAESPVQNDANSIGTETETSPDSAEQNRSAQPDTSSLEDLMNRLNGSLNGNGQEFSLP